MRVQHAPATSAVGDRAEHAAAPAAGLDRVWFASVLISTVVAGLSGAMRTVDLAYHVRAGTAILQTGQLPGSDTYTFTAEGRPWVDQQWGAQVVLALVHRAGGWASLLMLLGLVAGATFGFLWLACRARGASAKAASLLVVLGLAVSLPNISMRPQTFAFPLFTLSLWILATRHDHPRRLWILPGVAVLWANLHGTFPLLPAIVGLAAVEDVVTSAATARIAVVVTGVSLLATLVNPFGVGAWSYAAGLATNGQILYGVEEWAPPTVRTLFGAAFFGSGLLIAVYLARRRPPVGWVDLVWLGLFFVLGLAAIRSMIWWGFVAPVVVAGTLERKPRQAESSRAANVVLVGALAALLVVMLPWWRDGVDPATGASRLLRDAPQHLVEATGRALPPGARVLVNQEWASWFEYALPEMPVFVDSRIELFTARTWTDYFEVVDAGDGWSRILDRWRVDAVVLQRDDELVPSIEASPEWRRVYVDRSGTLYVRT